MLRAGHVNTPEGLVLIKGAVDGSAQARITRQVMEAAQMAPFRRQVTPNGRAMSVFQTSLGPLGWVSDRTGYAYVAEDPLTGAPWPPMPGEVADLWGRHLPGVRPPDSCLVNLYGREGSRLGLHRDHDEEDLGAPVLSLSLGASARFRIGGPRRSDPTARLILRSGDVLILSGAARGAYHGVDGVLDEGPPLVEGGGRLNLTLRRARG